MPRSLFPRRIVLGFRGFLLLFILTFLSFLVMFGRFHVSAADWGKFVLGLFILAYIPGQSLLLLLRFPASRLERTSIALALGMGASTLVNKYSRFFQAEFIFGIWLALALGYFVYHLIRQPPRKTDFRAEWTGTRIGLLAILLLVVLMLCADSYQNGIVQPDGSLSVRMHYYDGFIRNAVIREVSHSVPPQMPFAAGYPLGYHYGLDLFVSMFYRYLGLGIFDLNHRLLITFFLALLALSVFTFIRDFLSSEKTALWGTFLLLFGSGGMTFLAGPLFGRSIGSNFFHSFYLFDILGVNSLLPALVLIFSGFLSLTRYLRNRSFGGLVLTGLFFALAAEFKVFLIVPVLAALAIAGLIIKVRHRDSSLLKALAVTILATLPLFVSAIMTNKGGPRYSFALKFVDWISPMLRSMGFETLASAWNGLVYSGRLSLLALFAFCGGWLMFALGSFGLSLVALPAVIKAFFSWKRIEPARLFFSTLTLFSILCFFSLHIALGVNPRDILNIYVFYLGLALLLVFWVERLMGFLARKRAAVQITAMAVVLGLSVPNTIGFLWAKARDPRTETFSREFLEVTRWLTGHTPAESIVLHPLDLSRICYLGDRRVVLDASDSSYLDFHILPRDIRRRREDIERFFADPQLSGDILEKYRVGCVIAWDDQGALGSPGTLSSFLCYASLGPASPKTYIPSRRLSPVFRNRYVRIYEVHRIREEERRPYILDETGGGHRLVELKR